jgi:K+-sensing histidine kinase KdpD
MRRPDVSAERMVAVTKRYGSSVVLVLSALLVRLLVHPETLVGPVFLFAVLLSARLGGMGPGLVAALLAMLAVPAWTFTGPWSLSSHGLIHRAPNRPVLPDAVALTH